MNYLRNSEFDILDNIPVGFVYSRIVYNAIPHSKDSNTLIIDCICILKELSASWNGYDSVLSVYAK